MDYPTLRIKQVVNERPVIIFGAGETTKQTLECLNEKERANIIALIDNDRRKIGSELFNIPIYSPKILEERPKFTKNCDTIIIRVQQKRTANEIEEQIVQNTNHFYKIIKCYSFPLDDSSTMEEVLDYIRVTNGLPIMVYQMGKVGSRTIVDSLYQHGFESWHIHYLSKKFYKWLERREPITFLDAVHQVANDRMDRIKVISLVRNPLERNVSSFFQNIERFHPDLVRGYRDGSVSIEEIIEVFFQRHGIEDHDQPLTWWDRELKGMLNFNVFEEKFPKEEGYCIYHTREADILLIKLEKLNECAEEAFEKFLGIKYFRIKESNRGNKKSYYDIYQDFKNKIKFPIQYVNKYLEAREIRHFYTDEEIESMRRRVKIIL
ncbi:MAG: hypothetical protein BLM47_11680 [Candidatus Reconcilbacillus cellulovorans]|uniref:Uncharacterized protein n=1 Tax=Candidatus Reconcilbacillus cellulovorans TaxID=1906605 RepID=A0A2A6DXW0_9BACL|nr:MAG: hypothetical protein BLM47_11680 [Candidatus Reconcilbacillus cellulovorans]